MSVVQSKTTARSVMPAWTECITYDKTSALQALVRDSVGGLPISMVNGGTGKSTQPEALTSLLGSSVIPIANGGTGVASLLSLLSQCTFRAVCATAAAVQTKQIYVPGFVSLDGLCVKVKFSLGSTYSTTSGSEWGRVASGSNTIDSSAAPVLSVYSDKDMTQLTCSGPIKAEAEYVGECFVQPGGEHILEWDATDSVWIDHTTRILYEYVGSSYSYRKETDGRIIYTQKTMDVTGATAQFSCMGAKIISVKFNLSDTSSIGVVQKRLSLSDDYNYYYSLRSNGDTVWVYPWHISDIIIMGK